MTRRRELFAFAATLGGLVVGFFHESLLGGRVLSPGDVVYVQASFAGLKPPDYEPANRLLMDPVLQFQPWLEFNRAELRAGRLPLWNPFVGCGAPHLANGQSAVFDPFHAIAYFGTLPQALATMAAARLWVAGLGMFLLAHTWGLGAWGRWFAGLTFPFCGFLVAWLLYPVANVAIWMPWVVLATEGVLARPSRGRVAGLAVATACLLLGGHIQTAAHVLLACAGYVAWRRVTSRLGPPLPSRRVVTWIAGVALGVGLAAIQVVPLGFYLSRSPVWGDRLVEKEAFGSLGRPRFLEAVCTALPYAYGSQRRGHPHLAPALGVQNLNESAGGFAGLATLIWLAPLGWSGRRASPRAGFLGGLALVGAAGAFGIPPIANGLRAVPVMDVIDHRRLTLWVGFGLVLLGGVGLDRLAESRPSRRWQLWGACWAAGAFVLLGGALAVARAGPRLLPRALEHYARSAASRPGSDPDLPRRRAERQVHNVVTYLPRYYALAAGQAIVLAGLLATLRRGRCRPGRIRVGLLLLTLTDLLAFGYGLNPAIPPADDRPEVELVARLRRDVPPPARLLAIGDELPPNLFMRYGLIDCRNYDSIEATRSLDWLDPLYEPEPGRPSRTSRRTVTWAGVVRALERLRRAGVAAVVADEPPPEGVFRRVERVGRAWVAWPGGAAEVPAGPHPGEIRIDAASAGDDRRVVVPVTFDPGWAASVDGRVAVVEPDPDGGAFLAVRLPPGTHRLTLRYDPPEVRASIATSGLSLAVVVALGLSAVATRSHAGKNRPRSW